jgi:hypothetical protein
MAQTHGRSITHLLSPPITIRVDATVGCDVDHQTTFGTGLGDTSVSHLNNGGAIVEVMNASILKYLHKSIE